MTKRTFLTISIFLLIGIEYLYSQDSPGSTDHDMISRYIGSVIDGYEVQEYNEYVLPLGQAIKDSNGKRVPSEKLLLEGKITRILYRGPDTKSTLEILRNYQSALEKAGFQILFTCSGEDCGYLFHWHLYKDNEITNTKTSGQAFDMPKDIRYISAKKSTGEAIVYVSLLVAIDAIWTKKTVTLLEIIESKAMEIDMVTVNADAMADGIESAGHIALYGIYFDTESTTLKPESNTTLEEIGNLMKEHASLNLIIVGHTDNQGGYGYNMDLSQRRATSVVKALIDKFGVSSERLTARGVGYLSPVNTNDTSEGRAKNRRVELVKN